MKTRLLVLAAGMGSRFGGVKQVAAAGPSGESILEYSVYDALRAGFEEVVFLIREEITEEFRASVLSRLPRDLHFALVFQDTSRLVPREYEWMIGDRSRPWGTGHAMLCAVEYRRDDTDTPFAVINADDFYGYEALKAVHDFLGPADPARDEFCMAGYRLSSATSPFGPVSRGVCSTDDAGFLTEIEEHLAIERDGSAFVSRRGDGGIRAVFSGSEFVSMNLWGFSPAVFPAGNRLFREFLTSIAVGPPQARTVAEFYLPGLVASLVGQGQARVRVLPVCESPFGLTYKEDLGETRLRLSALSVEGRYPAPLWSRT